VRVPLKLGSAFGFLAVFGCQASDDLPPGVTVTDSAGVRIVQAGELSSATDTWRIPPEPTFRTGWEEGEPSFQTVGSGELLPDGRVVVADHGANRIYWLARDGSVRVTAGREGGGPGELQGVSGLAVRGDTAVVYDFRQSKLAAFVAGAFETERRWAAVRRFLWELAGSFPDGGYLMLPNGYRPDGSESPGWVEAPVIRIAGDLTTADTVASLPLLEISEAGATSSGGPGRIVVTGRGLAHGYPDRTEARWLKLTGGVEQIVRWDADAPSTSRAEFERRTMRAVEELVEQYGEPMAAPFREQAERIMEGALPLFAQTRGDPEGNLWLSEYVYLTEPTRWFVVGAEGVPVGWVELPGPMRVLAIGADAILVVEENELDVDAVAVYSIEKEGGS